MKKRKIKWWLAGGFLAAAATVNFQVAANRESACALLFAENVDAKTGPIDDPFRIIWLLYQLGERLIQDNNSYFKLDVQKESCPDLPLANGTLYYGTEASRKFLQALQAEGSGNYSGTLDAADGVSYNASILGNTTYTYDFSVVLHFDGLYETGFCHPTTADDPNKLISCQPYDDCAEVVTLRAAAYRKALGL